MANYKVVDAEQLDNDLRSIADTIRAKNGTTEDINFPEGYIAAYESTPTIIENVEANLNFANGDQTESLPEGYAARSVKIKKPENLTPENIAEGVEIAGIVGTHEGGCDHNIIEHIEIALDFSNGDQTETLPEGYSVSSATILKPDTLIPENIAKDVEIAGIIGTHEGGSGGSVEGTAKVTFCNYDGSVLYTRLVFIGDDCKDPITQGKLDTPTRASDVQYHYTFSGWSETQGGTASSTALQNITADKTVYAAYTTSLVYYTVRFYDGDTLMQESQVAYGQKATPPNVSKEGHKFIGWTPSDLTITGDTDFYGEWKEAVYLYAIDNPTGLYSTTRCDTYSKNGELLFLHRQVAYSNKTVIVLDATTNPYTEKTSFKTINADSSYVGSVAINPSGTMAIATHHYKNSTIYGSNRAYEVFLIDENNTVTNASSTYYTKPSLSNVYSYSNAVFNCDGTRMVLFGGSSSLSPVVFDTTTTPFTELGTITSSSSTVTYITADNVVASKVDPNVIYMFSNAYAKLFKADLTTLKASSILNSNVVGNRCMLSNAQDKIYYYEGSGKLWKIYSFDNTTHQLGTYKEVSVPDGISITRGLKMFMSPDDKKLMYIDATTSALIILNVENDSFTTVAPPDTVFAPASSIVFDESGTKCAMSGSTSPYVYTYVADPAVNS